MSTNTGGRFKTSSQTQTKHQALFSDIITMVLCEECGRDFKTEKAMKKHHTSTHNAHLLRFPCEWCEGRYLTESNLRRHALSKHPDITVKTPKYSVFNQTPREQSQPVTVTKPMIREAASYRFNVIPGTSAYKGAPAKLIKHQSVQDRPLSPPVYPTPTSPGTPVQDERSYLNTTMNLETVIDKLYRSHAVKHQTNGDRFKQLLKDLATTSDEQDSTTDTSINTSATSAGSDSFLSKAVKRKNSRTPVCSGSKRAKIQSETLTSSSNMSSSFSSTSGVYQSTRPRMSTRVSARSSTPHDVSKSNSSFNTDLSAVLSSSDSKSRVRHSLFDTPPVKPQTPVLFLHEGKDPQTVTHTGNNSTAQFEITDLVTSLVRPQLTTQQVTLTQTPTPQPLVDYGSYSDNESTPDRDLIVFQILDLVECLDSSKSNVMKDILDMMFPKV